MKTAIFLRAHSICNELISSIEDLKDVDRDVYLLYDSTDKKEFKSNDIEVINFTTKDYERTGFPLASLEQIYELPTAPKLGSKSAVIYYNPEYAQIIAKDYLEKKGKSYDYYWYLEYDVAFTGDWNYFFDSCDKLNQDLICVMLRQYPIQPSFERFYEQLAFDVEDCDKFAFFGPIWRASKLLLETLKNEYLKGKHGFYELIVPTIAALNGLSITDLNAASNGQMLYNPITMNGKQIRKYWTRELIKNSGNMLFHPFYLPEKSALFATAFIKDEGSFERYETYINYYQKKKTDLGASQIFFIDDGSDFTLLKKFTDMMGTKYNIIVRVVNYDDLPEPVKAEEILWVRFRDNIGRKSELVTNGWWRSFSFSYKVAEKYFIDKLIHIESDTFIFADKVFSYLKDLKKGWTCFYSEHFAFPDTCIQVISKEHFNTLETVYNNPFLWEKALSNDYFIAEFVLPFTDVVRFFKGDRYGEDWCWSIPEDCDYISNMGNVSTEGIFEITAKNKKLLLKQKIEEAMGANKRVRFEKYFSELKAEANDTIMINNNNLNVLFCTGYINSKEHIKRYVLWIKYYYKLRKELGIDKIVVIDDGSHYKWVNKLYDELQKSSIDLNHYDFENLPENLPEVSWIRFPDNLGRPEFYTCAGWMRSFSFSWVLTQKYDVSKLVHIESDFYLFSDRIHQWIRDTNSSWHSLYSNHHNMAETAIQIISSDSFKYLKEWWTGGRKKWFIGREKPYINIAENILPIKHKNKDFIGDRYGEDWCKEIPEDADYVGQVSNTYQICSHYFQNVNDKANKIERKILA